MKTSFTKATAFAAFMLVSFVAADAMALDGYRDRRGVFGGIGIGGGAGTASVAVSEETAGFDDGRKLGLHLSGIFGTGVTRNLVVGVEGNWWNRTVLLDTLELSHNHLSFNAVGEFFLLRGIYVEGGAGFAYGAFESARLDRSIKRYGEMGLSVKGGAGVEFFLNSDLAMGVKVGYTRHLYAQGSDFDTLAASLSFRWY